VSDNECSDLYLVDPSCSAVANPCAAISGSLLLADMPSRRSLPYEISPPRHRYACVVHFRAMASGQGRRRHLLQLSAGMGRLGIHAQVHQGRFDYEIPHDNKNSGQALAQILAERTIRWPISAILA
jgi:hypothetical protein